MYMQHGALSFTHKVLKVSYMKMNLTLSGFHFMMVVSMNTIRKSNQVWFLLE